MTKQKAFDWLRRGAIVLLFITALLLLRYTGFYTGIRNLLSDAAETGVSAGAAAGETPLAAVNVLPLTAAVCGPEGASRYGAAYSEEPSAIFRRFSVELGEALGTAGSPVGIDEAAFRDCLTGCGVCFRFACPAQLRLLAGWLGTEMHSEAADDSTALLCLAAAEGEVSLCYRTTEGQYYRCATAAKADALRARTAEYPPNGAQYAWETDRLEGGDILLLPDAPVCNQIKSAVTLPQGGERDALLQAVGMNSFVASSYSESDGTVVYVSEETSLRINPSGTVFFRVATGPDAAEHVSLAAAADSAWRLCERSIAPLCGEGALYYAGASYNESQRTVTVELDYMVDGVPVALASGHAAEIVLRGDTLIQARLQLRSFTRTEETASLLPWLQAAAIAAARGGEPRLVYADAGDATECMWVIADG